MRILKRELCSSGDVKVIFTVNIEGVEHELTGFVCKNGTFEFAKNECYYLQSDIGASVLKQYSKEARAARIKVLETELNQLKGVQSV